MTEPIPVHDEDGREIERLQFVRLIKVRRRQGVMIHHTRGTMVDSLEIWVDGELVCKIYEDD